ncbi:MAG: glycosyltransferase family 4 protein [Synergistaceae bacterium]|nr:glycosyltransferase family 4 protein [Synergistaceae bacterium]
MSSKYTCLVNGMSIIPPISGVGRVVFELCRRDFHPEGVWAPLYHYGHYSRNLLNLETTDEAGRNFKRKILKSALSLVRSNYTLKRAARKVIGVFAAISRPRKKNDSLLYWEPNHVMLEALDARNKLLTIHDLSCLLYPQWHPRERLDFFDAHFLPGIGRADAIVTVSDTIRQEVIERLRVPENRVFSVHNGVDRELFRPLPGDTLAVFRERADLPERYVLCVGSLEPRKNLASMLDAWLSLPGQITNAHKLLIISNSGWNNRDIMEKIRSSNGSVHLRTDVPTRELPYYYNLAELTVYVSLYEGFGLPPVEAMACGTPVLASDIPVHREVLGDAAAYVEPRNTREIAECLETLLTASPDREKTAVKCLERASLYSWEKSASKYLSIMEKFL